uniref:Uncharacterized protein n=1 Tax=Arundo donax TaxID=35708 RepID=A0A0A9DUF6_ARUDO
MLGLGEAGGGGVAAPMATRSARDVRTARRRDARRGTWSANGAAVPAIGL